MANFVDYQSQSSNDYYVQFDGGVSITGELDLGYSATVGKFFSSAIRFTNVIIPQGATLYNASLHFRACGRTGTNTVKTKIEGFDEDNTADFSGGGPGSRPKTSASVTGEYSSSGTGWYDHNVTNIVNEIVQRGGWSSGNALGFWLSDNGTSTGSDSYITDVFNSGEDSVLSIKFSVDPDFTPGPYSVSAKNVGEGEQYGLLVSKQGFEADGSLQQHTNLTSQARVIKTAKSAQRGWPSSSNQQNVSHGLKYAPGFMAYITANDRSFYAPYYTINSLISDPSNYGSGTVAAFPQSDPESISMVKLSTAADPKAWYYYVMIEDNV